MPHDEDRERFGLPLKTSVEISAELYLKASSHAAQLRPPQSVETFIEQLIREARAREAHVSVPTTERNIGNL